MKLGAIIHAYRKEHKISMDVLASRSGLSKAYIAILENERNPSSGKPSKPSLETIQKLAKAMATSTDDLISKMDADDLVSFEPQEEEKNISIKLPRPESVRTIPVYGELSCGAGLFVDDQIIDTVSVPVSMLPNKNADYFAQYASGDSMTGAGIQDGDLIIFKKTNVIDNGQIGCFCIDENVATCKKFSQIGGSVYLLPANDKYQPIPVEPENTCFRILGTKALLLKK